MEHLNGKKLKIEFIQKSVNKKLSHIFDKDHYLINFRARSMLDSCFCLTDEPRKIFLRILSLYSLSNWWDERESDKGQPGQHKFIWPI